MIPGWRKCRKCRKAHPYKQKCRKPDPRMQKSTSLPLPWSSAVGSRLAPECIWAWMHVSAFLDIFFCVFACKGALFCIFCIFASLAPPMITTMTWMHYSAFLDTFFCIFACKGALFCIFCIFASLESPGHHGGLDALFCILGYIFLHFCL